MGCLMQQTSPPGGPGTHEESSPVGPPLIGYQPPMESQLLSSFRGKEHTSKNNSWNLTTNFQLSELDIRLSESNWELESPPFRQKNA